MMSRLIKTVAGLLLTLGLVACGGGGGSPGTVPNEPPPAPVDPATTVADFALFTDKTMVPNSGGETAKLTVKAVDAARNVVSGASVAVSVDNNAIFTPGGTATDATGTYTGEVSIGADKGDRDVTISVTINGMTKQTAIRVAGSRITLSAAPSAPAPGQSVTLTATLVDSEGNAVSNVPLTLGGTIPALSGQIITTNLSGVATRTFAAPAASGTYLISASGNGVSAADYQLTVFSTAAPPVAVIPAGAAPSLAASPNVLSVNAPGSTANSSTLKFLFLDPDNAPVVNVRVRFDNLTTGLPAVGSSISSGSSVLYTDSSGIVTAKFYSGQNPSPTNGVLIRACYSANDFAAGECPNSVSATLTVAGQALAVSIGDDNLLEKGNGTYIKRFVVTVADSAGKAVANAPVDISVDLTHYGKGPYSFPFPGLPPNSLLAGLPADLSTNPADVGTRVWCPNEDTNRNGNADPGENINDSRDSSNQETLEPRKSDLIISYDSPDVTTTDAGGILIIKVEYSQRFATWLGYRVRVTANVAGSQGMAERNFVTSFIEGDDVNGSFLLPPYGFESCSSAD